MVPYYWVHMGDTSCKIVQEVYYCTGITRNTSINMLINNVNKTLCLYSYRLAADCIVLVFFFFLTPRPNRNITFNLVILFRNTTDIQLFAFGYCRSSNYYWFWQEDTVLGHKNGEKSCFLGKSGIRSAFYVTLRIWYGDSNWTISTYVRLA